MLYCHLPDHLDKTADVHIYIISAPRSTYTRLAKRLLYASLGTEVKEEWSVKDPSQHATTFPWHTRELAAWDVTARRGKPRHQVGTRWKSGFCISAAQDRQVCEKLPSLGIDLLGGYLFTLISIQDVLGKARPTCASVIIYANWEDVRSDLPRPIALLVLTTQFLFEFRSSKRSVSFCAELRDHLVVIARASK
jgi:hypothetical protein